jgi:hypothetical protein
VKPKPRAVVDRAAEQLGATSFYYGSPLWQSIGWVALEDPGEADVPLNERMIHEFTLLDDDGQLVWGVSDFSLVPYQQILRSAEAGVLKGNPRRLYIIRGFPQADLDLIPWASLVIRGALADACVYRKRC